MSAVRNQHVGKMKEVLLSKKLKTFPQSKKLVGGFLVWDFRIVVW